MIIFFITIISLLIGFYLGTKVDQQVIEEEGQKVVRKIKQIIPKSDLRVGVIKRPTPKQLFEKKKDPEKKAADEAMKETLAQIPELEEARRKVEELKEQGVNIDAT